MMDYAAVLYFDPETNRTAEALMRAAVDAGANDYMPRHSIPPHVTLAYGPAPNEGALAALIEKTAVSLRSGGLDFSSIGVFNPRVLFLAPVMDSYLLDGNKCMNDAFSKAGAPDGHYLPGRWVPHMTIATQLTPEELRLAFAAVQENFSAFSGRSSAVALVRCNPYVEIRRWPLAGA